MKKTFLIIPTNEGQELNYGEIFEGNFEQVFRRADVMRKQLQKILKQGTIDATVEWIE